MNERMNEQENNNGGYILHVNGSHIKEAGIELQQLISNWSGDSLG